MESLKQLPSIQPINDRVIVRRFSDEFIERVGGVPVAVTKAHKDSLIVLAEPEKEVIHGQTVEYENLAHLAEVVAVGPGKWMLENCCACGEERKFRRPVSVKVGDLIYFGRFVDLNYEGLCILQEDDVLGIVPPEKATEVIAEFTACRA